MPRSILVLTILPLALNLSTAAQQREPAKPQTPRQALIEMMTGGPDALMKHLTIEVQASLKKAGKGTKQLGMFEAVASDGGSNFQTFETGPILFSVEDPKKNSKYEVHVDDDDLSGDVDTMDLSLHEIRDGQEQQEEWSFLTSHFSVGMKKQQEVWRLDKITMDVEFAVGDAKFVERFFGNGPSGMFGFKVPGAAVHAQQAGESTPEIGPETTLSLLAFAEGMYANQHPEAGFSCSLPEVLNAAKDLGALDPKIATGTYNGYKFAISGCEGKPAGSFQIVAEPLVFTQGAKAYCTDATHNIRTAEDGHGATCLMAGKGQQEDPTNGAAAGSDSKPKK